jgi:hypothetical protein
MPAKLAIRVEGEGFRSAPLGLRVMVLFMLFISVGAWGIGLRALLRAVGAI